MQTSEGMTRSRNAWSQVLHTLVLANIILTEFEKLIVSDLVDTGLIKFHRRYVDDTLILVKPNNIPFLLEKCNSSQKSQIHG